MAGKYEHATCFQYIYVPIFFKTEDQCSQVMKQAAKETFESNMHHHDAMKTIAKAYLSNREYSVHHILPELKLRRIFPAVYFVNTNPPEERVEVLLPEKELSRLRDDSPTIFKKFNKIKVAYWKDQVQHSVMENTKF